MDQNDREQFWITLCSLPGNDIVAEREQLFKSIKYPKLLFGIVLSAQKAWKRSEQTSSIFFCELL